MKIAICEDDSAFAARLFKKVQTFCDNKNEELTAEIFDSFEAAESGMLGAGNRGKGFSIIFMDINLGGSTDGVELVRKLRKEDKDTPVVFVTGYENRAVDGYDVSAFGFIVKKNMTQRLEIVMERYWDEYRCLNTLTVQKKDEVAVLPIREIIWAEADKRCTLVHSIRGDYHDMRPIGKFSEELGNDFQEVFKFIFVNINHIKSINKDTVTLSDDSLVPLSRRHKKSIIRGVMDNVSKSRMK